jgi:molecular chaperone HscB
MASCSRCAATLETPLGCLACGALASLPDGPEALDPFAVLGLAPAYSVDRQDLRRRLLRFSRMTHPDFFATAAQEEKERAERATAALNSAYAVLSDDATRADHLVRSLGGPDENAERAMPQDFLMEVLEWNELLDGARRGEPIPADFRAELESRRARAIAAVAKLLDPLPAAGAASLREARRGLNVVRYVDRALGELEALRLSRAEAR